MQLLLALLPCAVSAAGMIACLVLFSGLSRGIRKSAKGVAACEASIQTETAQLTNALNELKRRVAELENAEIRTSADLQPAGDLSGVARGRVFKLHRAGQGPDDIAQKLRLSKGEVELLIKAQRIVMRPYESELAAPGRGTEKG